MNIKDIVNRDLVNLQNCEQEPIHIPGSIQPHGALLGLKTESWHIDFASGNCHQYFGFNHRELLGRPFQQVFGEEAARSLGQLIHGQKFGTLYQLASKNGPLLCMVHISQDTIIIEAEAASEQHSSLHDIYAQTRQFLSYMEANSSLQQLCHRVAENTREITGYDRVMIYRFDEDYNGEIFAESCREDLEPFLGLHYPHTDIPVQARELYLKNLVRLIVDINYQPVPLYTVDDRAAKNLDLSLSILRSVSPIHVQYLQNMGVGATLTISLIHKNRLWGLIACHHYSAKNISPEIKLAAQLQGHFITSQIDTRQLNEEYEASQKINDALEGLLSEDYPLEHNSFETMALDPRLLQICNAGGVALLIDKKLYTGGIVPSGELIHDIIDRLRAKDIKNGFITTDLGNALGIQQQVCENAAGAIYYTLIPEDSTGIIWFRPETVKEVNWAGDPAKAIIKDEKGLSPRNSFALWKEIVKCRSKPWRQAEMNAASQFAHALQKHVNHLMIAEEEKRYRELSDLLRQTNSELENINWISTHDLQEPLRKIQLFASHLLEAENGEQTSRQLVQKINHSAARMQVLLKDILKYTRVKNTDAVVENISLDELIHKQVLPELEEQIQRKKATVEVGSLPDVKGIPFLLRQVFSNLILNSLKFSGKDRLPHIRIVDKGFQSYELAPDRLYQVIEVSDNGIGFEQKYAENIFNVFTRLHSQKDYEGSGIGLALCKKIMESHHGHISAIGSPGEGAKFRLHFPVES